MARNQWLLIATAVLSLYSVGQVWLVQTSSYRLFPYVGAAEFRTYHMAWWRSIWSVVLAPAALVFAGSVLMLWWRPPAVAAWAVWLGLALQVALLLGTAMLWGPLMARLEAPDGGLWLERYQLLMTTHWFRVGIVTAYGLLVVWMLTQSGFQSKV